MLDLHAGNYLDDTKWSDSWSECLDKAMPFFPQKVREIHCLVPLPDRSGNLIIAENGLFFSSQNSLTILHQFSVAYCFPSYDILSSMLTDMETFGKYKLPWVCPYFSLFPLSGLPHSIWINPLKIEDIYTHEGRHYAKLIDGFVLAIPIRRYYILLRAEMACGLLASLQQDYFLFSSLGDTPLDYLTLPNTSFSRSLVKRPLLQLFATRKGEIYRRYQRARFLHYYDQLVDSPEAIHWENWN